MKRQMSMFLMRVSGGDKTPPKKLNKVDVNNLFKRVQDNNYKDWIGIVQHIEKFKTS